MKTLKTFVINLPERLDRKGSILKEFATRSEFNVTIVSAERHEVGSWGLWQTIKTIVNTALQDNEEFILICEDDHVFTPDYNRRKLFDQIYKLSAEGADLLLGGVSWFEIACPVSEALFWIKKFNGLQFTVVFRRFYESLLSLDIKEGDNADVIMSMVSNRSFVCFPYISIQKEFGYSDITPTNAEEGYVTGIFDYRMEKLRQLKKVAEHYNKI